MQITRNKKIIIFGIVFLFFVSCLFVVGAVRAQDNFWSASQHLVNIGGNPKVDLESSAQIPAIIGAIINGVLGFLGVVCLVYIIYAGIRLMTAGGNEEIVQEARATIKWALIGVIVVIGAYALSSFVVNEVLKSAEAPVRPGMPTEEEEEGLLFGYDCPTFNCYMYSDPNDNYQAECEAPRDDAGQACCTWVPWPPVPGYTQDELGGTCESR